MHTKKIFLHLASIFFLLIILSSDCEKDPAPDPVESNVVEVKENINSPTLWDGDSIYLIKKWDFYVNNTLTIEPGTVIKFHL